MRFHVTFGLFLRGSSIGARILFIPKSVAEHRRSFHEDSKKYFKSILTSNELMVTGVAWCQRMGVGGKMFIVYTIREVWFFTHELVLFMVGFSFMIFWSFQELRFWKEIIAWIWYLLLQWEEIQSFLFFSFFFFEENGLFFLI